MVSQREEQSRIQRPINILGWYGRNNLGDESFKLAFQHLFPENPLYFSSTSLMEGLDNPLLILGGGDVIKPYYLSLLPKDRPFYALGVGLGYESELDLLDGPCQKIYFRNYADYLMGARRGLPAKLCPDLAFAIPGFGEAPVRQGSPRKKMVVILANSAIHPDITAKEFAEVSYFEYFKWELAKSLDYLNQWYDIGFLHLSNGRYAYDIAMHYDVMSRMRSNRNVGIMPEDLIYKSGCDTTDLINTLRESVDLVVSMKYHGLIFATIAGVPFVNIGVTRKTALYCKEYDFGDFSVESYSFTKDRFLKAVEFAERGLSRQSLIRFSQKNHEDWERIGLRLRQEWLGLK
jgi:polysaccharide pyruvyl transferase WcaK-like protein